MSPAWATGKHLCWQTDGDCSVSAGHAMWCFLRYFCVLWVCVVCGGIASMVKLQNFLNVFSSLPYCLSVIQYLSFPRKFTLRQVVWSIISRSLPATANFFQFKALGITHKVWMHDFLCGFRNLILLQGRLFNNWGFSLAHVSQIPYKWYENWFKKSKYFDSGVNQ